MRVILLFAFLCILYAQPTFSDNCLVYNQTSSTCRSCVPGFFLQYFFCLPCAPLCLCSNQYEYCDTCVTIPFGNSSQQIQPFKSNDRCFFCDTYMSNCLQCSSGSICTKCYGGYYPVVSNNESVLTNACSSVQCQNNCELCLNQTTCQYCMEGFFLDKTAGNCSQNQCQANCLLCEDQERCQTCQAGYFLFITNGTCTLCNQPNCVQCLTINTCQVCQPGYYVQDGTCQSTGFSNCVIYTGPADSASGCQFCEPGYFMLQGNCNQCVGCNLCSLQFLCQSQCLPGTIPFNYACNTPLYSKSTALSFFIVILLTLLI